MLKKLKNWLKKNDAKLFGDMLEIYNKIDKWWINEIEIPIVGNDRPEDYDRDMIKYQCIKNNYNWLLR